MKISSMENIPAGSNPFHYDMERMGTRVNKRFTAMFHPSFPNELVIVDLETGQRKKLVFPKTETKQNTIKNHKKGGIYA